MDREPERSRLENRETVSESVFKEAEMNKEIVVVLGYNGSGKSTIAKDFVSQGYQRINRDELDCSLEQLIPHVLKALLNSNGKVVLDNTYATIDSRKSLLALAKKELIPVRCVWLTTSLEDAQLNACLRMMERYGKILSPEEMKKSGDPNAFPPAALYAYRKAFQEPTAEEGFSSIVKKEFKRTWAAEYTNKALILDFDDTLRRSIGPKDWPEDPSHVEVLPGRTKKIQEYKKKGYKILGASNQSAIAKGLAQEKAVACFEHTNKLLGVEIEYMFCPHKIPPVVCYCRKPHAGMGAHFIFKYKLNPSECLMVGDQTSDETFAERCGFQYQTAEEFFK
jgi:HAD superfamily hydrolase (TIGR01662 family)